MTTINTINNNSNEIILNDKQMPQFTLDEYQSELNYFNEYDQEMVEVVNETEYQDYYQQEQDEEIGIMDDSLLKLIVDVQCYLSEASTDSPLFALQYKMYTYLKQRAFEMGMEVPHSL
jgi:U3 small nucleolar ribonucleoprotein component